MKSVMKSNPTRFTGALIILTVMLLNPFIGHGSEPDFAFPQKVEKNAEADLKAALKSDDGKGVVDAVVRLGLAKAQVNTDSLTGVLARIADLAARVNDPGAKALLNLLSAKIYTDIYMADRWTYDRRETIANPGDDYKLWSSRQLLDKVMGLVQEALADPKALQALDLKDYEGIVEIDSGGLRFYPTLFDFIASTGIRYLDRFARSQDMRVLSPRLMESPSDVALRPGPTCRPLGMILGIYSALIEAHADHPAPLYAAEIAVRKFVDGHLFSTDTPTPRYAVAGGGKGGRSAFTREMLRLYDRSKDDEFAGMFLINASQGYSAGADAREIYPLLTGYRDRFPGGFLANDIDNDIKRLSVPSVNFKLPTQVRPDIPVTATLSVNNAREVKIDMFDVSALSGIDPDDSWVNSAGRGRFLGSKVVNFDEQIPYTTAASVELVFPAYGLYTLAVSVDGERDDVSRRVIRCSDLSLSAFTIGENSSAWVADAVTGSPVADADIYFRPWSRRRQSAPLQGSTDKLGEKALAIKEYGLLSVRKGNDIFSPGVSVSTPYSSDRSVSLDIAVFTSLGLYRPGDEMDFAIVAYENHPLERKIAPGRRVGVELRDANYQPVDTIFLTTDSWGRAEGKFTLPSVGLTGNFQLRAGETPGASTEIDYNGYKSFMVSDYKLPTFELKTVAVNRPASTTDSASVVGEALSYSGFPIAEGKVKASLKVQQGFWWWQTTSPVFFTTETVTDEHGRFTVEIPASAISSSPAPTGIFVCGIEVTSPDGETREMTARFNMGKPLGIGAMIPAQINLSKPFSATVRAFDANNEEKPLELEYTITRDTTEVAHGKIMTGSVVDVLKTLPSGKYRMVFAPVDTLMADTSAPCQIILYKPQDDVCPVEQPMWVPVGDLAADASGKFKVTVGSDRGDAHVRLIVSTYPGKVEEKRWVTLRKGMQEIELTFPDGAESARVNLDCVKDFTSWSSSLSVKAASTEKSVKIEIETFRDKVMPGQEEKVTFRVTPTGGATPRSAVFLDMSNKAIDVLASNPLQLDAFSPYLWNVVSNGWDFSTVPYGMSKDFRYKNGYNLGTPTFQLYGMSFTGGGVRIRGSKNFMMRSLASAKVANTEEAVAEDAMDLAPLADSGVTAYGVQAEASLTGAVLKEESVEEEDGGNAADTSEKNEETYRPSEIPLAFFRPMLTTAEDGSLEISYTVPDANTTWILRAMSYNKQLLTSSTSAEIISSKPVMVSQNAPRFLRTADSVVLAASVMNNTDTLRVVNVVSEVLSASTGKVVAREETTFELAAKGSAVATVPVVAPVGETGLIYRVKASSSEYTDGEQCLLPVLPSEQDVTESEMFYLAPDQSSFSLPLPAMGGEERAYLNFTENPSWQVVSALPGLRDGKINSSVEAAAALFSAAVADGLMRDNPEIARVLRRWVETGDSALVSNLEKNSELKTMLLNSTPWVSEALSDTERMQRLALLFDKGETRRVISDAIDRLAQTRSEGGWAWSDRYPRVSRWATEVILDQLGDLNRMGWLPSDSRLQGMIKDGVAYLDREAVKEFAKYPKADYWLYVSIRDKFPGIRPSTAASRVIESEVQKAVANWKNSSVPMKGIYALILHNHGYDATARQVIASLREYSTSTPGKGMWWQQLDRYVSLWSFDRVGITSILLDAFHAVEPASEDVEKIRQWLILNKTNNDWGSAVITTQTIASILTSGKSLKVNPRGTAIHIGDALVTPQGEEYATGSFTEQITSMLAKPETLIIDRQADYPSVGGVVMMRRLPMDSIKAVSCQEIAVSKSLSVFNGEEWVPGNDFKVGDRVRVELTLTVEDDLSYVVIEDLRAAGLEPAAQLPAPIVAEGLWFYRENRDAQTNIFIDFLPRGTYRLAYELYASQAGHFSSGVAQVQSQYNPIVSAHSAGMTITVK